MNMEDGKVEPDESAEAKLPDAEESLAMRKLLVSLQYLRLSFGVVGVHMFCLVFHLLLDS